MKHPGLTLITHIDDYPRNRTFSILEKLIVMFHLAELIKL